MRATGLHRMWALGLCALLLVGAAPATAADSPGDSSASADGYPTWQDVQRARESEAATAIQVRRVRSGLDRVQAEASAASMRAVDAQRDAQRAQAALDEATARADALHAQAASADSSARRDTAALGRFAGAIYRARGHGSVTLELIAGGGSGRLLQRLSVLDDVTSWWKTRTQDTLARQALATSLHEQAQQAQQARSDAADTAAAAASAAGSAADAADAAVAAVQTRSDTLFAQLAVLRGTTADRQRRYELGVQVAAQAAAEQRAREAAASAAAANTPATSPAQDAPARSPGTPPGAAAGSSSGGDDAAPGPKPAPPESKPAPAPPKPTPPASTPTASNTPSAARAYARSALGSYGWASPQFTCLNNLWNRESGWRVGALNPYSGAYGIPQALPGSKMAIAGADWRTSAKTQVEWGLAYISDRYGSPCGAWAHSQRKGWY